MGVDVFSAGDWSEQHAEPVRFEDRALGVYKKLTIRDGKLAGVILVGDTSDSHRYMDWLRTGDGPDARSAAICCFRRRPRTPGLDIAADVGHARRSAAASASPRARSSPPFTSRASTRCRS